MFVYFDMCVFGWWASRVIGRVERGVTSVLGRYLIFYWWLPTSDRVLTCTFADDTAILSSHCNPVIASSELNCHLKHLEIWYNNWRIRINELKSKHVTFTLRKGDCPPVFLNNIKLPHESKAVYLGIHLDRRLTFRSHIEQKNADQA